jgi:hypothetical protein
LRARIEFIFAPDPVADTDDQGNAILVPIKAGQSIVQLSNISFPNTNLLHEIRLQTMMPLVSCLREGQLHGMESLHPPGHLVTAGVLRSTLKRTFSPYAYLVFFWSTFVMRKHR